jgi:hypothetical protein
VKSINRAIAVAAVAALLTGCGGGSNGGASPTVTQANLTNDKLQLVVGTAFNEADGTTGLNVVATFRQSNGLSAVDADEPSITGPSGFTVPAGFPGAYGAVNNDDGTATISSSPQVNVNQTPTSTTLGTFTGVFSYGLAPLNSDNYEAYYVPGDPNAYPGNGFTYSNYDANGYPFFLEPFGPPASSDDSSIFLEGPPAVPFFNNGLAASGFAGYSPGFTAFEITPVAGTYTMNIKVPTTNGASPSFTATATLSTTTSPLTPPVIGSATPTTGGLTGTVTIGAGAVETLVFITDYRFAINPNTGNPYVSATYYYTVEVTGTGSQTWTLPGTLGPCSGSGCQNGASTQTASLTLGDPTASTPVPPDDYTVQAISFDYSALEDGPPGNTSQTPTIAGTSGQADLSIGGNFGGPGSASAYGTHRTVPLSSIRALHVKHP